MMTTKAKETWILFYGVGFFWLMMTFAATMANDIPLLSRDGLLFLCSGLIVAPLAIGIGLVVNLVVDGLVAALWRPLGHVFQMQIVAITAFVVSVCMLVMTIKALA